MKNLITDRFSASPLRHACFFALAAAALGGAPAVAANHPAGNAGDGWQAPALQLAGDRDRHWEQRRGNYHHHGYRDGNQGYYGGPPVIYAPPGYYTQPGISLNFGIPLY